jgi:SNF2 family DNA or RNA helicase
LSLYSEFTKAYDIPSAYKHQKETSQFISRAPCTFVASDPGTGKTRSVIDAFVSNPNDDKKMLVFCPKSIMLAAWGEDLKRFAPQLTFALAVAPTEKRLKAFASDADVVIINHDAAKWCNANVNSLIEWFDKSDRWLVIDESTAFKSPTSQRTRAMMKLSQMFDKRIAMSGFPTPNNAMELWAQMKIVDDGQRMGSNYYQTRHHIQHPIQEGQFTRWVDKEDAQEQLFDATSDITVRHKLEDVLDMPEHINRTVQVDTTKRFNSLYNDLAQESRLQLKSGELNAVNAAVLQNKLLQLCSGAVYYQNQDYELIHPKRYELVMELVSQRKQSLVAYMWKHQLDYLLQLADTMNLRRACITSDMSAEQRNEVVQQFQAGLHQVLFAHPQSAGHGITLTKARTIIWSSPTWSSEQYVQFNRRIYRAGQKSRTEVINIAANGTIEGAVYDRLNGKIEKGEELLGLFEDLQEARAA